MSRPSYRNVAQDKELVEEVLRTCCFLIFEVRLGSCEAVAMDLAHILAVVDGVLSILHAITISLSCDHRQTVMWIIWSNILNQSCFYKLLFKEFITFLIHFYFILQVIAFCWIANRKGILHSRVWDICEILTSLWAQHERLDSRFLHGKES
jgi:hypothetical protein